jgi:hypothetical protein
MSLSAENRSLFVPQTEYFGRAFPGCMVGRERLTVSVARERQCVAPGGKLLATEAQDSALRHNGTASATVQT